MAKGANKIKAKPLKLSATPKLQKHLEALVLKELYGRTPTEVAQRLLEERIRVLVVEGTLKSLDDETPEVATAVLPPTAHTESVDPTVQQIRIPSNERNRPIGLL